MDDSSTSTSTSTPPPPGPRRERLRYEEVAQLAFLGVEALTRVLIAKGIASEIEIQAAVAQVRREYTAHRDEMEHGGGGSSS